MDFAIGLVNSVVHLPDGQVRFFGQFEEQKKLQAAGINFEKLLG